MLFVSLLFSCSERDHYIRITGYAQGGTYGVSCNLKGVKAAPSEIQDSIDSILHLIDTTLSGYNKGSLLSRFNAGEAIRPNKLFLLSLPQNNTANGNANKKALCQYR